MTGRELAAEATRLELAGRHAEAEALWNTIRSGSTADAPPEKRRHVGDDERVGRHYWRDEDGAGHLVHCDRSGRAVARARLDGGGVLLTYPGEPRRFAGLKGAEKEARRRLAEARTCESAATGS